MNKNPVVILEAGPSGLATAYELIKQGVRPIVLEKADKVWGIPCNKIQAEWAAERIKGLSLIAAVTSALLGIKKEKN